MKRIKVTDNFYLDELIDPSTYAARGAKSIELLDMRAVAGLQYLREQAGPLTVNNWATGGQYKLSGLRPFNTSVGAKFSQHKFGRAFDIKSPTLSPAELFEIVKRHERYFIDNGLFTTVEELEDTPSWFHIDCRYTGLDHFNIVSGK